MDYEEIYSNWDNLPHTKIRIDCGEGGENLWGRELPDGTVGLDNNPLYQEYRWQDIVRPGRNMPELIHRRWHHDIWFKYDAIEDDEAELEQRKQMVGVISAAGGNPNFWAPGMGHFLCKNLDQAETIKEGLIGLDIGCIIDDSDSSETH